jgi:hypothetical protein
MPMPVPSTHLGGIPMTAYLLSVTLTFAPAAQKEEAKLDEKIAQARAKAVEFLKKQQKMDGMWEGDAVALLADMEGGFTALTALALLEAGVPAKDPAIAKAVEYLVKLDPKKTYVVSLQTQVLCRLKEKKHLPQIQNNANWLIEKAIKKGESLVGWSYPGHELSDGSNTHFAVVALHEAAQAGAKVNAKIWIQIRDMYSRTQTAGGWGYYSDRAFGGDRTSFSMTTCGLLGLTIAAKYDKDAKGPDPAIEKGMTALLKLESGGKSTAYQWMATAELGRALGQTEFKAGKQTRAWYREGTAKLLVDQKEDGSWEGTGGVDKQPIYCTACALYFLGPPAKK